MRPDDPRIGTEIAGYRIEAMLGRGGSSVVYLAEHVRLGRKVALKLLAPMLSSDETYRDRFQRESQRAAELDHPNVVPIFDAGEADGQLFIAMRYVEGCDLKALIRREGQLGIGRTLFILEQAADGLDAAHQHNLIHRSVKPANILIAEPFEHVYLTDFGVVKDTASRGLTATGFFIGTTDYAAPEQIEGLPVDARTDVYALGCVLYECLVGKAPFTHAIDASPVLTAVRPDLPEALNRVLARALAKGKDDRFESCGRLIEAARVAALQRTTTTGYVAPAVGEVPPGAAALVQAAGERAADALSAETPVIATPVTGHTDSEEAAQPSQATVVPPAAAPPPARPPASGGNRGGGRGGNRAWLGMGAAILVAALMAALAVSVITRDSHSTAGSTTNLTTGTGTPTTPPVAAKGLAGVVLKDVWDKCQVSAAPQEDAVQSAVCRRPAAATGFFPDRVDLYIYANRAAQKKVFEAFRASDPKSAALVAGQGGCSNLIWNGYGEWRHTDGKPGGERFCYTDGANDAIIVWTHDRLGTPSHLDFIGVAQLHRRGTESSLSSWWNFWHSRLGKCAQPDCIAHLP